MSPEIPDIRVGTAVDIHAFAPDIPLRLGGVTIPHDKGLKGHSDGDALLHAIASALLGSLALGDLGSHFPSSDPELAGIDSRAILHRVVEKVNGQGYRLVNVDTMVVAQEPRLSPHVASIRDSVAGCLGVALDRVRQGGDFGPAGVYRSWRRDRGPRDGSRREGLVPPTPGRRVARPDENYGFIFR